MSQVGTWIDVHFPRLAKRRPRWKSRRQKKPSAPVTSEDLNDKTAVAIVSLLDTTAKGSLTDSTSLSKSEGSVAESSADSTHHTPEVLPSGLDGDAKAAVNSVTPTPPIVSAPVVVPKEETAAVKKDVLNNLVHEASESTASIKEPPSDQVAKSQAPASIPEATTEIEEEEVPVEIVSPQLKDKGKGKAIENNQPSPAELLQEALGLLTGVGSSLNFGTPASQGNSSSSSQWVPPNTSRPEVQSGTFRPQTRPTRPAMGGFGMGDPPTTFPKDTNSCSEQEAWLEKKCPDVESACRFYEYCISDSGISIIGHLQFLAQIARKRFKESGDSAYIDKALSFISKAKEVAVEVAGASLGESASLLHSEATTYLERYNRYKDLNDLNAAVDSHEQAVYFTEDDDIQHKIMNLSNFAGLLLMRSQCGNKNIEDVDRAISSFQQVLEYMPDGHPDKPKQFYNLGNGYLIRFSRTRNLEDADNAIVAQQQAVDITPDNDPDKSKWSRALQMATQARFNFTENSGIAIEIGIEC